MVTPRPAAALALMRDTPRGPEVLLAQRNPAQRFMGGFWVFPGGARSEADRDLRATAARELAEEVAIEVDASTAVLFARWITPEIVKIRFDASFFLAPAPEGAVARVASSESVGLQWVLPSAALAAYDRMDLKLSFPTVRQLEDLSGFSSTAEALFVLRRRPAEAVMLTMTADGSMGVERILDGA